MTETATAAATEVRVLRARVAGLQADQATWFRAAVEAQQAAEFCDAVAERAEALASKARTVATNCHDRAAGRQQWFWRERSPSQVMIATAGEVRSTFGLVTEGWTGEAAAAFATTARGAADQVSEGALDIAKWTMAVSSNATRVAERAERKAHTLRTQAAGYRRVVEARQSDIATATSRINRLNEGIRTLEAAP